MAFSNSLTINPHKTKFYFAPNVASFPLKRYDVIVLISSRKLSFLPFFYLVQSNNKVLMIECSNNLITLRKTLSRMKNMNRIKSVFADTGHTGKWLADQLEKAPVTISKWCTNTSQPSLETIHRIAEFLNVQPGDLLTEI